MRNPIALHKLLLLLLAGYVLFIHGLGGYDLIAPDEPRFALVAKEMMETGNFLFPHRNEQPYPDKPPLFFWSIAAVSFLTGEVNAWSARLPSALAALGCLLLIARWASAGRWNDPIASATLIILATCIQFLRQAHNAQIDMLLCLLVLSATLLGYRSLKGEQVSQVWLGCLMGLAILAKGPVGYILPAGTWAFYCLASGRTAWRQFPYRALLWGLLPPLIWLTGLGIQVWQEGSWDYWNNLLFKQTVVRYTNPWHHHQPFYYFFLTQLTGFFPWILLLPLAFPWTQQQRSKLSSKRRFAWSAYAFILIFFTLSAGKRSLYILPLYPFAAYLIADYLINLRRNGIPEKLLITFGGSGLIVIGAGFMAIILGLIEFEVMESISVPIPQIQMSFFSLITMIGGIWAILFAYQRTSQKIPIGFAISIISLTILFYHVISPWHNERRSARSFSERVTAILESKNEPMILAMIDFRSAFRLYGNQRIVELSTFDPQQKDPKLFGLPKPVQFWENHPRGLIISRKEHLDEFKKKDPSFLEYRVLLDQFISDKQYQLIERLEVPPG